MRGRGSYRGSSQRGHGQERNVQGGPLMTNHLRELDIELEILKRKRDMIQQEHELLNREREYSLKRQYEQEPSSSYSQNSYRADYNSSNYYRQQGSKRQAVQASPPRRYDPPARVDPWAHNNVELRPKNYNAPKPQPLLSLFVQPQKFRSQNSNNQIRQNFKPPPKSLPARKDFNPTKVTKAKARVAPAKKQQKEERTKNALVDADLILQPDVTPSPQMNGRLELALGSILKDIKQVEPDLQNPSMTFYVLKMIKQIIRSRIRLVMTGKTVGDVADIVAIYRNKYPKESDAELVELGRQAQTYNLSSLGEKSCPESEDPKKYFKANLTKLLNKKVDEIFEHVKKIYENKDNTDMVLKLMDNVADLAETDADKTNTSGTQESTEKDNNEGGTLEKNIAKAEAYAKLMDALIENKLPKLLPKLKQSIISTIEADKEYYNSKIKIEQEAMKMAVTLVSNRFKADEENALKATNNDKETACDSKVIDQCEEKQTEMNDNVNNTETPATKPTELVKEVEAMKSATSEKNSVDPVTKSNASPVPTTPAKIIDFPYFVKLIGRPELPSRQAVYDFLEQFKPASIKKHKTVGNLLVLGFNDKDEYEKVLEASGTAIGTNTLIIKASEKVATTPQSTPVRNETNKGADKTSTVAVDQSKHTQECANENKSANSTCPIGSDLDNQITNLLTSIRRTDELNEFNNAKKDSESNTEEKDKNSDANALDTTANANKDVPMETIVEDEEKTEDRSEGNKTTQEENATGVSDKEKSEENAEGGVEQNETDEKNITDKSDKESQKDNIESNKTVVNVKAEDTSMGNGEKKGVKEENKSEVTGEKDPVSSLKESGRATPTRASARLATVTPSSIKTRRASRLAQNN